MGPKPSTDSIRTHPRTPSSNTPRRGNAPRIGLRCDAGGALGIGHLVRSLALAEELMRRGCLVEVAGQVVDSQFALDQIEGRGLALVAAPADSAGFAEFCRERGYDAVVIDGYEIARDTGAALRAAGIAVLSVHDGPWGLGQQADVYLDQNLGAPALEPGSPGGSVPADAVILTGARYTCFRDTVVRRRPDAPRPAHEPLRVLAFFGGTDVFEAAPVLVPLILAAGVPVLVHAVAAREDLAQTLTALPVPPGSRVHVHGLVADLPGLAVECDLAVSAAGTSTWEMLCLGVPAALVAVTENQLVGYDEVIGAGLAAPVGLLDTLRDDEAARTRAVAELRRVLTDDAHRAALSARGMEFFDGRGRERVADALLAAVEFRGRVSHSAPHA